MNYLAHLFFADPTPHSILGSLAADHFKGAIEKHDPRFADAIRIHRRIDAFTDSHPAVGTSRRRLEPRFGHYGRIIIDIFHDHLLATSWEHYHAELFDDFTRRMNEVIGASIELLPPATAARFERMALQNWIASYRTIEGIRKALHYTSKRLKRAVALDRATEELIHDRDSFDRDFHAFFPELIDEVDVFRATLAGGAE
ncbi:MAG TPA: ACP phosphodiesterase [Thermoanaerobaculia bacterium]|nr:ACP phosphodiesterase [Thermoanaerobaculia bacterium]